MEPLIRCARRGAGLAALAVLTACSSGGEQAAPPTTAEPATTSSSTTTTTSLTTTTSTTSTTTTTVSEAELVLEPVATVPGRDLTPFADDGDGMLALSDPDVLGGGAPPSVVRIDAAGTVTQERVAEDASALLAVAPGRNAFQAITFGPAGCSVRGLSAQFLTLGEPVPLDAGSCGDSITADANDPSVMLVGIPWERAFLRVNTRTRQVERIGLESVAPEGWGVSDVLSLPEANYAAVFLPDGVGLKIARVDRATGAITAADLESSVEERDGRLLLHLPDRSLLLDPVTLSTRDAQPSDLPRWVLRDTNVRVTVEHRDPAALDVVHTASLDRAAVSARAQDWSGLETANGYLLVGVERADDSGDPVTHIYRAVLRPSG